MRIHWYWWMLLQHIVSSRKQLLRCRGNAAKVPEILNLDFYLYGGRIPSPDITFLRRARDSRDHKDLRHAPSDWTFDDGRWFRSPRNRYEKPLGGEWVLSVKNAMLGHCGEVQLSDGRWVVSGPFGLKPRKERAPRVAKHIPGTVLAVPRRGGNYGNWLLHMLPRIRRLRQLYPDTPWLLSKPEWDTRDLLRMEGLDPDTVGWFPPPFFKPDGAYVTVDEAVFVSNAARGGYKRAFPLDIARFDDLVEDYIAQSPKSSGIGNKFYASRRKPSPTTERPGCLNRDRLERIFQDHGFQIVYPELLPFLEQVAMFNQAEIVVAEDGSAAHNALFCKPGTRLISVTTRNDEGSKVHWQRRICDYRGLHYRVIIAGDDPLKKRWIADESRVRKALKTIDWNMR